MTMTKILSPALQAALAEAHRLLAPLAGNQTYDLAVSAVFVQAGLHQLPVPADKGGLGGNLLDALEVLASIAAVDAPAALGLAMHYHTLGAAGESGLWPQSVLEEVYQAVRDEGALLNLTATEEGGSPARGALPNSTARRVGNHWEISGEKSWATGLPALRYAVVTARIEAASIGDHAMHIGCFLVDLHLSGVERLPAFDGLGMRASASGVLRLRQVRLAEDRLLWTRLVGEKDIRGISPVAWFGLCVAAVYLGIGEGARAALLDWALNRQPNDCATVVADLPSVRIRLGRLDAALRTARIVLMDVARRWQESQDWQTRSQHFPDIALAKVQATNAAVNATDEALRIAGGPGFLLGPLERAFRDARAGLIHPPLDDVAYLEFARLLVEGQVK